MCRSSSSTSSSSCSLGSTSFTSSCRRFLSNTCDCGGRTPSVPEDPLDPAEAVSLEFTEEELEGPLVRLPVAPGSRKQIQFHLKIGRLKVVKPLYLNLYSSLILYIHLKTEILCSGGLQHAPVDDVSQNSIYFDSPLDFFSLLSISIFD